MSTNPADGGPRDGRPEIRAYGDAGAGTAALPAVPGAPSPEPGRPSPRSPLLRRLLPSPAEAAGLRFLFPMPDLRTRLLVAAVLFAIGLATWSLMPVAGVLGLLLVVLGHLALWVKSQTTAPGGATPSHEEVWAPTEDGWMEQVRELERRGEEWDVSPWDLSSGRGCLVLLGVLAGLTVLSGLLLLTGQPEPFFRVAVGGAFLLVPLWLNGMRTTWNPSELHKKGGALEIARQAGEQLGGDDFDAVPLLALRQGRRGSYPVDARLMLRPASEDDSGFLGVQVQVALNNVRGTDYPYLYAVVLGKTPFRWPDGIRRQRIRGVDTVFERGGGDDVQYMVVRQHADQQGGWHTDERHVRALVETALELGREAWELNRGGRTP